MLERKLLLGLIVGSVLVGFSFHQDIFAATCSDATDETSCNALSFCAWESNMCVISLPDTGSLSVTKDASPSSIQLAGSGGQETTTITINVNGYSIDQDIETIFILDSSGSVGSTGWLQTKDFVTNVISTGLPDPSDPVGIITFSTGATERYDFFNNQDRTVIRNLIQSLPFVGGSTYTRTAVDLGINMFVRDSINVGSTNPKLMFLITDGVPNPITEDPCSLKTQLDFYEIKLIIIGVGNFDINRISCLVDNPSTDIIQASDFNALNEILSATNAQILATNAPSDVNLIETTNDYIVGETGYSLAPDSITPLAGGQTQIVWNNIAQYFGNHDNKLSIDETATFSFNAKSNLVGVDLEVNDLSESSISYTDPDGTPMTIELPQALITVIVPDSDSDGVPDDVDVCPFDADNDADGDGLCADVDACPADADNDADGDGLCADEDNCPLIPNPGQEDSNGNGIGDVCDNTPPVAVDDNYSVDEDDSLSVNDLDGVLTNDDDNDGDALTASLISGVSNGILSLNEDGSFDYAPNENFFGSDSFTYVANDGEFDSNIATVTITVNSVNDAPVCDAPTINQNSLWPPNHKMSSISVDMGATDVEGDDILLSIISIFQDEPTNGTGDGDTTPDAEITGDTSADIRAERSGNENGRVYTITVQADDGNGGTCTGTVQVGVPHDKKDTAIDNGANFDSTIP